MTPDDDLDLLLADARPRAEELTEQRYALLTRATVPWDGPDADEGARSAG